MEPRTRTTVEMLIYTYQKANCLSKYLPKRINSLVDILDFLFRSDSKVNALIDDLTNIIADQKVDINNLRADISVTVSGAQYLTLMFYVGKVLFFSISNQFLNDNPLFLIVAVVGLIFCFCVLWLSFKANMRDNSWEFGVLRALGLNVKKNGLTYVIFVGRKRNQNLRL